MEDLPLEVLLGCVDREIKFRDRMYPRWCQQLKMNHQTAAEERMRIRAVRDRLLDAAALQVVVQKLAQRLKDSGQAVGWEQDVAALRFELVRLHPAPAEPGRG